MYGSLKISLVLLTYSSVTLDWITMVTDVGHA